MDPAQKAAVRVALVDDHPTVRRGLELVLRVAGCEIVGSARTAEAGYDLISKRRPAVALVDLQLPDESGGDLTRRLVANDPSLGVLIYTGVDDPAELTDALDSGARGFALKAGPPEELVAAVHAIAAGEPYLDMRLRRKIREGEERGGPVLSPREAEVLGLLAAGLNGERIAEQLFLSPETVRTHVRNAMEKLDARTRVHAIVLALQRGEIKP